MSNKYYKYTLQGEHSIESAQRELGDAASQGIIVRIDNVGGKTHVYLASASREEGPKKAAAAAAGGLKREEVSESDITRVS